MKISVFLFTLCDLLSLESSCIFLKTGHRVNIEGSLFLVKESAHVARRQTKSSPKSVKIQLQVLFDSVGLRTALSKLINALHGITPPYSEFVC